MVTWCCHLWRLGSLRKEWGFVAGVWVRIKDHSRHVKFGIFV